MSLKPTFQQGELSLPATKASPHVETLASVTCIVLPLLITSSKSRQLNALLQWRLLVWAIYQLHRPCGNSFHKNKNNLLDHPVFYSTVVQHGCHFTTSDSIVDVHSIGALILPIYKPTYRLCQSTKRLHKHFTNSMSASFGKFVATLAAQISRFVLQLNIPLKQRLVYQIFVQKLHTVTGIFKGRFLLRQIDFSSLVLLML